MKYPISILLACLFTYAFLPGKIAASEQGLRLSPLINLVDTTSSQSASIKLTIENLSNQTKTITTDFLPFRLSQEGTGSIVYLPEKGEDHLLSEILSKIKVYIDGNEVTMFSLVPHQKRDILLKLVIPYHSESKSYTFSSIFASQTEKEKPISTISTVNLGLASHILLSVDKNSKSKLVVDEFASPNFVESGPISFFARVRNTSNQITSLSGSVTIQNMFGQTIGNINVPSTLLPHGYGRYLSSRDSKASNTLPQIIWNEKLLLGPYKATLNLRASDEGPRYVREIWFFAFPIKLFAAALLSYLLFIYIRKKLRLARSR